MTDNCTPLTVCLIDDDYVFRFTAEKTIQLIKPETRILAFGNALEALEFFAKPENALNRPDIIFLDIRMPIKDGWDFLKEYPSIPKLTVHREQIYLVSSSMSEEDWNRGSDNVLVTDFIIKPLNHEKLYNILKRTAPDAVSGKV